MKKSSLIFLCIIVTYCGIAEATTEFYTIDMSVSPIQLVKFNSEPSDSSTSVVTDISGLPTRNARMAYSEIENRLYVVPYGNAIYEIDLGTGVILDTMQYGESARYNAIEGIASNEDGFLYSYASTEEYGNSILKIDFDLKATEVIGSYPGVDLDDLDFDSEGNLINTDINQTGNLYRLPLDGSSVEILATFQVNPLSVMTFSEEDSAFYFLEQTAMQELWRLDWANELPVGTPYYVKDIGIGLYSGITTIPEPATLSLLSFGGLMRRRKRR